MFELSNEQRICFALNPVRSHWECIEAKAGPYDQFKTILYLDGDTAVKCILTGDTQYLEYELSETVSSDRKYLLPKTAKGKAVLLSSSNILKRKGTGMRLSYYNKKICLYSEITECSYYSDCYLNDKIYDISEFSQWVDKWCYESNISDKEDILAFSKKKRKHVRYKEGDVFRFKIGRRHYGYGRIILDYNIMRKSKEPFWDILMSTPVVCSVYHIVTDRPDVSVSELSMLCSLPSTIITDNSLFYGEFEIIGNIPVADEEDYPIMYGNSIVFGKTVVCYQCGKTFRMIENKTALYPQFTNNSVSFSLNFTLDILLNCISENSNAPYWTNYNTYCVNSDLRNPKYAEKLKIVKEQFGL